MCKRLRSLCNYHSPELCHVPFSLFFKGFCQAVERPFGILSFHFSHSEPSLPKEIEKKYVQANLILAKKAQGGKEKGLYTFVMPFF